jgi:hypothetical protein
MARVKVGVTVPDRAAAGEVACIGVVDADGVAAVALAPAGRSAMAA